MSQEYSCKLMCVVAHQDDEAQCAGAILRATRQGEKAVVVWMTNGSKGWTLPESKTPEEVAAIRRTEAEAALKYLGAEGVWLDYEDSELVDDHETALRLAAIIREHKPEVVVTHAQDTWHNDHIATSRIATRAIRLASSRMVLRDIPPHAVRSLYYFVVNRTSEPDFYLDITDLMEDKITARVIHKTQFPGPAAERYRTMAALWGMEAGVKFAEAYQEPRKRVLRQLP